MGSTFDPQAATDALLAQNPEQMSGSESTSVTTPLAASPKTVARTDAAIEQVQGFASPEERRQRLGSFKAQTDKSIGAFADRARANLDQTAIDYEAQVKPLRAEVEKYTKAHDEAVKQRDGYELRMNNAIRDMDTFSKKIAAEQPHDLWADTSTPIRIAAMALAGLGGAAQGLYGDKTNPIVDRIDAEMKREFMLQKMRIEKGQDDYRNQGLLVGQMAQHFDRLEHAQDAAYVTGMQGVTARLEAAKSMLSVPKMRQDLDMTIAGLEMKQAETLQKLEINMLGGAQRAGERVMGVAADLQKSEQGLQKAQADLKLKQEAEARKTQTQTQNNNALEIPGWEFAGGFKGTKQEAGKLRDAEATTRKVSNAMTAMVRDLDTVKSPVDLLSLDSYRQWKAENAQLLEAARGPGFGQTGSRLTAMLKELEQDAFTAGSLGRMTPEGSKKLLLRAQAMIWNTVKEAMAERGGAPVEHGPGHHDVFGDE